MVSNADQRAAMRETRSIFKNFVINRIELKYNCLPVARHGYTLYFGHGQNKNEYMTFYEKL